MIPQALIREWHTTAPWQTWVQVEQDLVICRAVVEIFSHPLLAESLAFRGGTALHKLHLAPPARYSEDIDLVQVRPGPIGPIFDAARGCLDPWLGKPKRELGPGVVTLTYRLAAEGPPPEPMRLKIEINSREHFAELGLERRQFAVASRWFQGNCEIVTYSLAELLGSKLRALYQRRKGRDLFDLWLGLTRGVAEPSAVIACFRRFMAASGSAVSAVVYRQNLERKLADREFCGDMEGLRRADVAYDLPGAAQLVLDKLVNRI